MKMTPIAHQAQSREKSGGETECTMTPVTIAVGALIVFFGALIAFETTMLRSRSSSIELLAAAMPPLQELHAMVGVNKLPPEEIEDLSLVFPIVTKR
jgi:hypothetical protein